LSLTDEDDGLPMFGKFLKRKPLKCDKKTFYMNTVAFKICPSCGHAWATIDDFLSDPELKMNGYQVHFDNLEGGLFFFTHLHENCHTTLAIQVTDFLSLNDHPLLAKRDEQLCTNSNFCVHQNDLQPKPVKCECSWVREILQTIKNWPKASA
jgi:hypothetical protein